MFKHLILILFLAITGISSQAGIPLSTNFTVNTALPIEDRMVAADLTARDAIPTLRRWEGMMVYVVSELKHYVLVGGTANLNWTELSGSGGGGINNWVTSVLYNVDDVVIENDRIYQALNNHTSGTFATDLANGEWKEISAPEQPELVNQSTGFLSGGTLSVDAITSRFDMAAIEGQIIDSTVNGAPTRIPVSCPAQDSVAVTNLATQDVTYILIDDTCTITQQAAFPTSAERRAKVFVGRLNHFDRTTISFANTIGNFLQSPMSQMLDLFDSIGPFVYEGGIITNNGANVKLNRSQAKMFVASYNYATNNQSPNNVTIASATAATWRYATQTTLAGSSLSDLDPTQYDVGGTITALGGSDTRTSVQRVYLFPSGNMNIQYGQAFYTSLADAIQNYQAEAFVENPTIKGIGVLIAYVVMQKNCTDLTNVNRCKIIIAPKFGGSTGAAGAATTTMQQAYDNSSQPQVTTDSVKGAAQWKRGSAADTDVVTEVLNGAGSSTFSVTGNGAVSTSSTITATGAITGSNLSGTNTGDLNSRAQSELADATINKLEVKNKQLTTTSSGVRLLETGSNNELENPNFEHSTVTTGWTASNATPSANTTTQFEGKKSLSLALTGALSLTQSSTINAAIKSGVQMVASIFVNSTDVSDLQLCSLKNGTEDKCTATGGYIQGSGWRQLTVSFLGDATSNGLKLKSTDTTGTVLVDQAFVGVGSPIVDFTPDMVYSALISPTGVVSGENTDWINGNCSITSGAQNFATTCTFNSSVFTVAPNCFVSLKKEYPWTGGMQNTSSTAASYTVSNASSGAVGTDVYLTCQKQGADYKTSKAYVASSSDVSYRACTFSSLAWQGLGTVTNNLQCARKGQNLLIKGRFTLGTVSGSIAQLPLPTNFGTISTSSSIPSASYASGVVFREVSSANSIYSIIQLPSVAYLNFAGQLGNTAINPNTPLAGSSLWSNGDVISVPELAIPIQGWQDSSVIVGSFQGYNETPGTSRVETFSFSYGTTNANTSCTASPCSYLDQIGNNVTSVTRSTAGSYTANFSKTFSKLKCSATVIQNGVANAYASSQGTCSSCSNLSFFTTSSAGTQQDTSGTLLCQGIPQ